MISLLSKLRIGKCALLAWPMNYVQKPNFPRLLSSTGDHLHLPKSSRTGVVLNPCTIPAGAHCAKVTSKEAFTMQKVLQLGYCHVAFTSRIRGLRGHPASSIHWEHRISISIVFSFLLAHLALNLRKRVFIREEVLHNRQPITRHTEGMAPSDRRLQICNAIPHGR
jgi:hypothetical protein